MLKCIAIVIALVCLTDLASAIVIINGKVITSERDIKHTVLDDANLISTTRGLAVNHRDLLSGLNVKTVSINGDKVELYDTQCRLTTLTKSQLSMMKDKENVINGAIQSLQAVENGVNSLNGRAMRYGVSVYSMDATSSSSTGNLGTSIFNSGLISVSKLDENNMSIHKSNGGLPNNINRIAINNDVVTYVYNDGQVQMKPAACMSAQEQQLIQQLRLEIQEAKRKFDIHMQQFHQNMDNMRRNLHQNMQNMQSNMQQNMQNMQQNLHQRLQTMNHNLNNMFPPGFPFHNQPMMQNQMSNQNVMQSYNGFGAGAQMGPASSNAYAGNFAGNGAYAAVPGLNGAYGSGFNGNGAAAFSHANGAQATAGSSFGNNWPFGPNNNPSTGYWPFNG